MFFFKVNILFDKSTSVKRNREKGKRVGDFLISSDRHKKLLQSSTEAQISTSHPRAICGQRYSFPCFAWLWIWVRGIRAAAPKGTKSCRTQGDFHSSCLEGLNDWFKAWEANMRLARAETPDWRPERPGLRPKRPDLRHERPDLRP